MCLYEDLHFLPTRRGDNPGNLSYLWFIAHAHSKVNPVETVSSNQSSLILIRRGVPNDVNNNTVCVYKREVTLCHFNFICDIKFVN